MNTPIALALVALLAGGAWTAAAQKSKKPVSHTVTMDATSFSPASLTVAPGDSVTWVNKDLIPHTATSKQSGAFDSGTITPGESWKLTVKAKGELAYICQFHPAMKGTLRVQ